MENSKPLAAVMGPSLFVMSTSEMINMRIWATPVPSVTYLNGIILFATALYVIRIHHSWKLDWSILITITAWLGMALGLFRLFIPEAKQANVSIPTYFLLALIATNGLVMTWNAYINKTQK